MKCFGLTRGLAARGVRHFSFLKFAVLLGAVSTAIPCWAERVSNELVLRVQNPSSATGAEVVKLRFSSAAEAQSAHERWVGQKDVLSVGPNFLYRPAVHLQFKPVADEAVNSENLFLNVPGEGSLLNLLSTWPDVSLEPSKVKVGMDPLLKKDWAWSNIHMPSEAQSIGQGEPVTVAVIDTGVDYNHEDLVGAMWRKPSDPHEVGFDFVHHVAKPYDVLKYDLKGCFKDPKCMLGVGVEKYLANPGHGTHCAGHVGAVANNSLGIRGIGSAAKARIMALKFFYDAGEEHAGQGDDAAAVQSIDYAIANGAKVISASWGAQGTREDADKSEVKKALIRARDAGVIVVVAAGNDGIDLDSSNEPTFPAAYGLDNMIVVAAHDSEDKLAEFSSYGVKTAHISAPGVKILSTTVGGKYADTVAKAKGLDGKMEEMTWDGTSMATPIVAGAVALVWSKFPHEDYRQIRDRILRSARKVPALADKVQTGGVLDVSAALQN